MSRNALYTIGVDFTSSPRRAKPIVTAVGVADGRRYRVLRIHHSHTLDEWAALLRVLTPWVGGFDFPFGFPRPFMERVCDTHLNALGGARDWATVIDAALLLPRESLKDAARAWCDARPPGQKFAHRAVDRYSGSSPSMKWVNPPVLQMLHAGLPVLRALDASFPAHGVTARNDRIALEAYPGYLARVFTKASYKSDDAAKANAARANERRHVIDAVTNPNGGLPMHLGLTHALRAQLLVDSSGDNLDATLAGLAACIAARLPRWGVPNDVDVIEGWIAGVPHND
jgi:hypothetical protein